MAIRSLRNGRRDTRSLLMLCLLAALACWAPSPARGAGVPIEGMLLVSGWTEQGLPHSYFMDGASDAVVTPLTFFGHGDISPDTTKVAYSVRSSTGLWHATTGDIWVGNTDSSGEHNLTGPAGLGGVNCWPKWSPDGRMIAFHHASPVAGQRTCDAGWTIWLMAANGTNLHRWLPSGIDIAWSPSWAPDGYRIRGTGAGVGYFSADVTGAHVTTLPAVTGQDVNWSKDGLKLTYTTIVPDTVAGASGVWRQLCVADADGSNPRLIVQQFLKDSDIAAHIARYNFQPADTDWVATIRGLVGPAHNKWSPLGDQVVFLAGLPFDPNGPEFWNQRKVWLYDFKTQQLTQLTHDLDVEDTLSWAGPNTSSASPKVTVYGTSVTFSQVIEDGWTSIIRTEDLPPLPVPYLRIGNSYRIGTAAQVSGPATVAMSYADGDVASTAEGHLAILRYDEAQAQWEDITASRDIAQNVISGQSASLGLMGLAWPLPSSQFSDVSSSVSDPYWALWEVEAAYAAGIVKGYDDGTYHPTDPVTRDQMAVYVSRTLASGDSGVPEFTGAPTFTDVPTGYWALKYIEYAVDEQVVTGYSPTSYAPETVVDRGQMAVFIARAIAPPADRPDLTSYTPPTTATFPDVPTSFWAYKFVEYIAQASIGVTKGYPDGDYHPEYVCTRDQMAVYVARAFKLPL